VIGESTVNADVMELADRLEIVFNESKTPLNLRRIVDALLKCSLSQLSLHFFEIEFDNLRWRLMRRFSRADFETCPGKFSDVRRLIRRMQDISCRSDIVERSGLGRSLLEGGESWKRWGARVRKKERMSGEMDDPGIFDGKILYYLRSHHR
jgi:hypothetical protein